MDTQKPIASRDVTFDETFCSSTTAKLSIDDGGSINVAGPGGEVKKEMDEKIDLSPEQNDDQNGGTIQNIFPDINSKSDSNDEFEDGQERPASAAIPAPPAEVAPPSRRSAYVSKPPVRYGFNHLQQHSSDKRYQFRSNQPPHQTTLTYGNPVLTKNTTV